MHRKSIQTTLHEAPLASISAALRSSPVDLSAYITSICDRLDHTDPLVRAFLPEHNRRRRLVNEAEALRRRHAQKAGMPRLYGIPIGIKDTFRVDGFPTRAGSSLPPSVFDGPEAACVTILRDAGAIILGKTVTTEFAYFKPGPTRNPHNFAHTPGGSSSGSAAAVAAGLCPLALGTQAIGSIIRPAAYCGIVGFKPSFGRITTEGVVAFSPSADHVGMFTQDVAGMKLAAAVLCKQWQPSPTKASREALPTLGVLEGAYLDQAMSGALNAFENQIECLQAAGYSVRWVPALSDIEAIAHQHHTILAAEVAHVHNEWFSRYEHQYGEQMAAIIRKGQRITAEELNEARAGRATVRNQLATLRREAGVDLWVTPAATGPAPKGLTNTGDPSMNLPWTYAGLPAITLPAGRADNDLPLGLQCVAGYMQDEQLLHWATRLAAALKEKAT